jgi:hypothetical protein
MQAPASEAIAAKVAAAWHRTLTVRDLFPLQSDDCHA